MNKSASILTNIRRKRYRVCGAIQVNYRYGCDSLKRFHQLTANIILKTALRRTGIRVLRGNVKHVRRSDEVTRPNEKNQKPSQGQLRVIERDRYRVIVKRLGVLGHYQEVERHVWHKFGRATTVKRVTGSAGCRPNVDAYSSVAAAGSK